MLALGTAFRPPKASYRIPHPYVVISEEVDGEIMAVNFSDEENYPSSACFVDVAEYPEELTKRSVIYYRNPYEAKAAYIERNLGNGGVLSRCTAVSPKLLQRIIDGARRTPDIDDSVKLKFGLLEGAAVAKAAIVIVPTAAKAPPAQPPPVVIPQRKPRPAFIKPEPK
jgi:hypothetical protein